MAYKTDDGRIFDNYGQAQSHADGLARMNAESAAISARQAAITNAEMLNDCQKILNAYNAGNWAATIEAANYKNPSYSYTYNLRQFYGSIFYMERIAEANSDPNFDCLKALSGASWGEPYKEAWASMCDYKIAEKLHHELFKIGKKLWEKKNGRTLTSADIQQLRCAEQQPRLEESIIWYVKEFYKRERKYEMREVDYVDVNVDITAEYKQELLKELWEKVEEWEKVTGRKMTDEEQKRIAGRLFPKKGSTSSRSSSYNEPRGIFPSIVFGFVGGVGLASIISWIAIQIVGPFSSNAFFLGFLALGAIITFIAWRNRKTMLLIVMLALSVGGWLFALGIIPEHVSATAKAKAAVEQTVE